MSLFAGTCEAGLPLRGERPRGIGKSRDFGAILPGI